MVIKKYIKGIAFVVLMLSVVSFAVSALTIKFPTDPSGTVVVNNTVGDSTTFSIQVNESANFTWYINGHVIIASTNDVITGPTNATMSNYKNNSAGIGYWNITVDAIVFNGTDTNSYAWWWNVTAASPPGDTNTTPVFTAGPSTKNITDTSAEITFKVNQTDAITYVIYSNKSDLSGFIKTSNQTSETSRTVNLADLTKGTPYYYSVFAYNGTNQSLFTNSSPVSSFTTLDPTVPNVTSVSVDPPTSSSVNITFSVNQTDAITKIKYGKTDALELGFTGNGTGSRTVRLSSLVSSTKYYFSVFANNGTNQSYFSNSSIQNFTTKFPAPTITYISPTNTTPDITDGQSQPFWVKADQNVTVRWYKDGSEISGATKTVDPNIEANYTFSGAVGNYTITANASNANGSDTQSWTLYVRSKTFFTGDRIWDENRHSRTQYTWDVYSFSGFYYNLDDDLGNESLTITNIDRSLAEGDITYSTSPEEVEFAHSGFGDYQVIGFMADKYFAGYTANSTPSEKKSKSTIGSSQLHKVLLDDDDKRTVSEGGTLTLKEGYVLKITAVDIGAGTGQVWITLLKDGGEVDTAVVAGNEDYYYTKKVGSVSDLPVIAVHFDSVFRGREVNAVFIRGVFQISESYTQVKSGSKYGVMEVDSATSSKITMKNDNTVDLSAGNTVDLMGNLKIKVADNSSVLRFGLTVETTGTFEARGTIYNRTDEWTPMNFGLNIGGTSVGFYYDMDEDIGNEKLRIDGGNVSGTSLQSGTLQYSTSPQEVSFEHSGFGSYQVIGFMADKYFAGYSTNSEPSGGTAKSTIGSSQLHKVLLDDDEKRTVSEGGTLTLKEGYVLKITAVDIGAGTGQVWITLLKDGGEVDSDVVAGKDDYYYTKKVGSVSDLPVIAVHFDSVFRGREINAVFIRGVFQISESYTQVKSGSKYGAMEVKGASSSGITMENDNTIDLSQGSTSDVMGNIKFRVADSSDLRFYPFVMVTSEMIANQLVIDAPAKVMAGDNITIKVNAGGNPVDNASISLDSDLGNTDQNGILNYTLPKTLKGMYNITATKLGYEKAVKTIEIEKYIDLRLSLDIPAKANQFETLTILVKYNSTVMDGAAVKYDNETIGTTDSSGALNYTPQTSGTHTISASKSGYITVIRDIEVIAPYSEYKALDINFTPAFVYPSQKVVIRSNITNVGTKADTLPVDLIINGSVVDNRSVALGPHETKEINFTGNLKEWVLGEVKPGNYTVEIQGQKTTMPVQEEPLNLFLVAGIITILGAVLIFIMTSKEIISIEALKAKLKMAPATNKPVINTDAINRAIKGITSKFQKK